MLFDIPMQVLQELKDKVRDSQGKPLGESQMKAIVESIVRKCDLVSREEFDAQQAVLQRTRQKLEALEKRVDDLKG